MQGLSRGLVSLLEDMIDYAPHNQQCKELTQWTDSVADHLVAPADESSDAVLPDVQRAEGLTRLLELLYADNKRACQCPPPTPGVRNKELLNNSCPTLAWRAFIEAQGLSVIKDVLEEHMRKHSVQAVNKSVDRVGEAVLKLLWLSEATLKSGVLKTCTGHLDTEELSSPGLQGRAGPTAPRAPQAPRPTSLGGSRVWWQVNVFAKSVDNALLFGGASKTAIKVLFELLTYQQPAYVLSQDYSNELQFGDFVSPGVLPVLLRALKRTSPSVSLFGIEHLNMCLRSENNVRHLLTCNWQNLLLPLVLEGASTPVSDSGGWEEGKPVPPPPRKNNKKKSSAPRKMTASDSDGGVRLQALKLAMNILVTLHYDMVVSEPPAVMRRRQSRRGSQRSNAELVRALSGNSRSSVSGGGARSPNGRSLLDVPGSNNSAVNTQSGRDSQSQSNNSVVGSGTLLDANGEPLGDSVGMATLLYNTCGMIEDRVGWNKHTVGLLRVFLLSLVSKISANVRTLFEGDLSIPEVQRSHQCLWETLKVVENFLFYSPTPQGFRPHAQKLRQLRNMSVDADSIAAAESQVPDLYTRPFTERTFHRLGIHRNIQSKCEDLVLATKTAGLVKLLSVLKTTEEAVNKEELAPLRRLKARAEMELSFLDHSLAYFSCINNGEEATAAAKALSKLLTEREHLRRGGKEKRVFSKLKHKTKKEAKAVLHELMSFAGAVGGQKAIHMNVKVEEAVAFDVTATLQSARKGFRSSQMAKEYLLNKRLMAKKRKIETRKAAAALQKRKSRRSPHLRAAQRRASQGMTSPLGLSPAASPKTGPRPPVLPPPPPLGAEIIGADPCLEGALGAPRVPPPPPEEDDSEEAKKQRRKERRRREKEKERRRKEKEEKKRRKEKKKRKKEEKKKKKKAEAAAKVAAQLAAAMADDGSSDSTSSSESDERARRRKRGSRPSSRSVSRKSSISLQTVKGGGLLVGVHSARASRKPSLSSPISLSGMSTANVSDDESAMSRYEDLLDKTTSLKCDGCQCSITEFFEIGDKVYCETDYRRLMFRCKGCKTTIEKGQACVTLRGDENETRVNLYHEDCVRCYKCSTSLSPDDTYQHRARPFCKEHYKSLFAHVCAGCNMYVLSDVLVALGQFWHADHFVCAGDCGKNLNGTSYYVSEETGHAAKPYCERCYEQAVAVPCKGCGKRVTQLRDGVIVGGDKKNTYHTSCYVCVECPAGDGRANGGGPDLPELFPGSDSKLYCVRHAMQSDAFPTCGVCDLGIAGNQATVGNIDYHRNCLVCSVCFAHLDTVYTDKAEGSDRVKLYCKAHLTEERERRRQSSRSKCVACGKPIAKGGMVLGDRPFHSECVVCSSCNVSLVGGKVMLGKDKQLVCAPCHQKVNANRCPQCSELIVQGVQLKIGDAMYHGDCVKCAECGIKLGKGVACVQGDDKRLYCDKHAPEESTDESESEQQQQPKKKQEPPRRKRTVADGPPPAPVTETGSGSDSNGPPPSAPGDRRARKPHGSSKAPGRAAPARPPSSGSDDDTDSGSDSNGPPPPRPSGAAPAKKAAPTKRAPAPPPVSDSCSDSD